MWSVMVRFLLNLHDKYKNFEAGPRLLNEVECKELMKLMNFSLRRIEELKPYLQFESDLYHF